LGLIIPLWVRGGFAGRELEGRLLNDGIQCDFVRVAGETRTNIVLHEKETGNQLSSMLVVRRSSPTKLCS
jgi:6-phosphofructokinase 2